MTIQQSYRLGTAQAAVHQDGFTLLEVLVAFAIAAPALILLFGQGASAVRTARVSAAYEEAISRATSRLEAITDQVLQAGERGGDDGHGFVWHTDIVPLATAPARSPPRGSPYAAGTTLFAVTVSISWPGDDGLRTVALSSRRLGPAAKDGP